MRLNWQLWFWKYKNTIEKMCYGLFFIEKILSPVHHTIALTIENFLLKIHRPNDNTIQNADIVT